ncbi:MAG: hypothetical protein RL701_6291 [Pseudomonadota bacterium]
MTMDERFLLSRRTLLGGLGLAGACAMLPRGLRNAARAADAPPTRFIVSHVPEGMWGGAPRPSLGATTLGTMLGKLDPFMAQTTVISGLNMKSRDFGPGGDGHHRGVPHMLTGIEMLDEGSAGGASVDQKIAASIGKTSKFSSLQFGVRVVYTDTNGRPIWSGPGNAVPAMMSPWDAYTRVFTGAAAPTAPVATPTTPAAPKPNLRKSALDNSLTEISSLRGRLTASDRARVDSYQESLRDIERRLQATNPVATGGVSAGCSQPTLGSKVDAMGEANYPAVGKLQMDLIVAAMQCGQTRVASLQWGNSNDQCSYPWLGINSIGHDLAHNNGNCDPSGSKKLQVTQWYAEQFAYLLGKLKSIPEGTGSMLDNTVILWVSEFSDSNGHASDNLMWLLMGNAAGYFKQGQVLNVGGRGTNDLHTTLCNAFGIADKSFGNAAYCAGAIPQLRA